MLINSYQLVQEFWNGKAKIDRLMDFDLEERVTWGEP